MIDRKYQTFAPRCLAGFTDGLVFVPVGLVNLVAYGEPVPIWLRSVWYVLASFGFIAYVVFMHARYGQTLGKMVAAVKVLDVSESKLSSRQALMREIVPIILTLAGVAYGLPAVLSGADPGRPTRELHLPGVVFWLTAAGSFGWFVAEVVTMLTNSKRRAVHDFIAGSVVVRETRAPLPVRGGIV